MDIKLICYVGRNFSGTHLNAIFGLVIRQEAKVEMKSQHKSQSLDSNS